jgi:hypothetical protein
MKSDYAERPPEIVLLAEGFDMCAHRNQRRKFECTIHGALEHRAIESAPRPSDEEFEVVIMIAAAIEEMHGSDRVLT